MPYLILIIVLLLILVFVPQWWARYVFRKHSQPREDIQGSGSELAEHLLAKMNIRDVGVEQTDKGDHYDPEARMVRLSEENFAGKSLTAVAVAAHEVGHAIQHHRRERALQRRTELVKVAQWSQQLGAGLMFAIPVIALLTRMPHSGVMLFLAGLASMGVATVVHLVTLPVEWDASFRKALPMLRHGGYVGPKDAVAIRSILLAAALTYVAASLASLLNLSRWLVMLRRG